MSYLLVKHNENKEYSLGYSLAYFAPKEEEFSPLLVKGDILDVVFEINREGGKLKHDFYGGVEVIVLGNPPIKEKNAIVANVERLNLSSRWVKYAMALEGDRF